MFPLETKTPSYGLQISTSAPIMEIMFVHTIFSLALHFLFLIELSPLFFSVES